MRQTWWRQLWDPELAELYPRLKAIVYFEEAKHEGGYWKDWRIVHNATVRRAYVDDLNVFGQRMLWQNNVRVFNSGSVRIL